MKNFISDVELRTSEGKNQLAFYSRGEKGCSLVRFIIDINEDDARNFTKFFDNQNNINDLDLAIMENRVILKEK